MEKKKERAIIFKAVREAIPAGGWGEFTRHYAAVSAALKCDGWGLNVAAKPYLQDIFIEALDKKEKEGAFRQEESPCRK